MYLYSNSMKLKKLKKDLMKLNLANNHYVPIEVLNDICKCLTKPARQDLRNNYKNGILNYKNMRTETLKELDERVIIAGNGEDTTIIIDDIY